MAVYCVSEGFEEKAHWRLRTAALNGADVVLKLSTSQIGDGTKDSEGCSLAVGVAKLTVI